MSSHTRGHRLNAARPFKRAGSTRTECTICTVCLNMQLPLASSIVSAVLLLVGLADPESTQAVTADATTTATATPIATLPPSSTLSSSAPTETILPTLTLAPATPTCVCSATTGEHFCFPTACPSSHLTQLPAGTATYNGNQIGSALAAASTTVR